LHTAGTGTYPRANFVMRTKKFTSINNKMESKNERKKER
jgi:hypothetical protein